jgi:hydroxylaminobenzene mutase
LLPLLVKLGICELAAGALSGWAMVAMVERPEGLKRLGVRQLGRIRQTHLDLLMQGTILAAVGAAVTSVPTWIGILLVLGAYIAPLTLGVLAFRPELQKGSLVYRGLNTAVLAGFTVGWVALAVTVLFR